MGDLVYPKPNATLLSFYLGYNSKSCLDLFFGRFVDPGICYTFNYNGTIPSTNNSMTWSYGNYQVPSRERIRLVHDFRRCGGITFPVGCAVAMFGQWATPNSEHRDIDQGAFGSVIPSLHQPEYDGSKPKSSTYYS